MKSIIERVIALSLVTSVVAIFMAHAQMRTDSNDAAGAPGFSWNSNTTTGLFQPATNIVAVSTGGTERARITSAGISTTGTVRATGFIGDGSGLTNVSGDNLGNHTATQNLALGANALAFGNTVDDKICLYSNTYGIGIETSTVTNWSGSQFRWRTGGTSAGTGTQRMLLGTTGLIVNGYISSTGVIDAGAAIYGYPGDSPAAPGYTWSGDNHTGMFWAANDIIGFSTGGTERVRFNSGGISTTGNISLNTGGNIYGDNGDATYNSGLILYAGSGINNGASVQMYGKDHATAPGRIIYYGSTDYAGHSGYPNNIVHQFIARNTGGSNYSTPLTMYADGYVTMPGRVNTGVLTPDSIASSGEIATTGNISLRDGGGIFGDPDNGTAYLGLYAGASTNAGGTIVAYASGHATAPGRMYYYSTNDEAASTYAHVFYSRTTAGTNTMLFDLRKNGAATLASSLSVGSSLTVDGQLYVPSMSSSRADNTVCLLASNGRIYQSASSAGCTNTSDIRLKKDIETLPESLEKILALRPVSYHWKDQKKGKALQLGFIAQEVDKIIPEITVKPDAENPYWGMYYNALIPYLVKSVQEVAIILKGQDAKIAALQTENATLKQDMTALKKDMESLKAAIKANTKI